MRSLKFAKCVRIFWNSVLYRYHVFIARPYLLPKYFKDQVYSWSQRERLSILDMNYYLFLRKTDGTLSVNWPYLLVGY